MEIPEYITKAEVSRVCKELGLRDWSHLESAEISLEDARAILDQINVENMDIPLPVFRAGLEVELEHGTRFPDANVTNNHPLLTGKIVLAHLKESMEYYLRLDLAEIEGDMLNAAVHNDGDRLLAKYRKWVEARQVLSAEEARVLRNESKK